MRPQAIFITLPLLLWSATASAGERFCLRLDPEDTLIRDASPRPAETVGGPEFDYGEDYGRRFSGDWGVARMHVHIETMSGTDVWGTTTCDGGICALNFLPVDNNGCTSYVETPGGTLGETFRIRYLHTGSFVTGASYAIRDCSSSNPFYPNSCASATNVISDVVGPAGSNLTHYQNLPNSIENILAWELAFSMKRFTGPGHVLVKYYDDTAAIQAGISGTHTTWSSQGYPQINIRGDGYRSKFTMAHEYGHAYSIFRIPTLTTTDLNHCYNSSCGHDNTSVEYQAAAATEGFAEFFSAAVWNSTGQDAQGYMGNWQTTYSGIKINLEFGHLDYESNYYETQICSGTCLNGIGVELDWARTFWDFYTNYSPPPLMNSMALVFEDIYPWSVSSMTNAYYTGFHDGVENVLGSTWESRFIYVAQVNGIDY